MTSLQRCIAVIVKQHGGLNIAARAHRVDPAYLSRLASGKKSDPSAETLRRLGIVARTTYAIRQRGKP